MPFLPLRLILLFVLFVPEGMLLEKILGTLPMFALEATEPKWYWILGYCASLYLIGFVNGRHLRSMERETRVTYWVFYTTAAILGTYGGMMVKVPPSSINAGMLFTQAVTAAMSIFIFFSLAHIQDDPTKNPQKQVPSS